MYYFVGKDGIKEGQELWLDYGAVSEANFGAHISQHLPSLCPASPLRWPGALRVLR